MTNLLVEFKDNILTGCRLVDEDCINAFDSIFTKVRVSTMLHRPPQFLPNILYPAIAQSMNIGECSKLSGMLVIYHQVPSPPPPFLQECHRGQYTKHKTFPGENTDVCIIKTNFGTKFSYSEQPYAQSMNIQSVVNYDV